MSFGSFANKRLCDVVFPGTHDAGVYGNHLGATARTQKLNLGEQAAAGVRYFDLRVLTIKSATGQLELRAYHAPKYKHKVSHGLQHQVPVLLKKPQVKKLIGVGFERLEGMLAQARNFVLANNDEFLILRFSKCGDMVAVADACVQVLGGYRFNQNVNLNVAAVNSLQGRVVTVFDQEDFDKFPPHLKQTAGILPVKAMFNEAGHARYDPHKWGLQYFGKYSNTRDTQKNIDRQLQTLMQAPPTSPEMLGMMYWTLTTKPGEKLKKTFESIQARDMAMWAGSQHALSATWETGVKQHIQERARFMQRQWLANGFPQNQIGRSAKSFMPNIIMMDFADPQRCTTVWSLNQVTANMLATMGDDLLQVWRL